MVAEQYPVHDTVAETARVEGARILATLIRTVLLATEAATTKAPDPGPTEDHGSPHPLPGAGRE